MSVQLWGSAIIADRYKAYATQGPVARRYDRDETWVFSPQLCRALLDSTEFVSRRTRLADCARNAGCNELGRFYSRWLMYTDGPEHTRRKSVVSAAISQIRNKTMEFDISVEVPQGAFELVSDYCEPFAWESLPRLLGLSAADVTFWRKRISKLVALPGIELLDSNLLSSAEKSLLELRKYVLQGPECKLFKALCEGLKGSVSEESIADLAINVIGDGIHPTLAGLAAEIWLRISESLYRGPEGARTCLFHKEAPFQYVARIASTSGAIAGFKVEPGDRVVLCLGAANRAGSDDINITRKPLTFGRGRHVCPGRSLAEDCIVRGTRAFFENLSRELVVVHPPVWVASVGYRAIARLLLDRAR